MKRESSFYSSVRRPEPPPGLMDRALRAAYEAAREPPRSLTDRIWESRFARLAWLSLIVVLLPVNIATLVSSTPGSTQSEAAVVRQSEHPDTTLQSLVGAFPVRRRPTLAVIGPSAEQMLGIGHFQDTGADAEGETT
jgi:hypothetical protein